MSTKNNDNDKESSYFVQDEDGNYIEVQENDFQLKKEELLSERNDDTTTTNNNNNKDRILKEINSSNSSNGKNTKQDEIENQRVGIKEGQDDIDNIVMEEDDNDNDDDDDDDDDDDNEEDDENMEDLLDDGLLNTDYLMKKMNKTMNRYGGNVQMQKKESDGTVRDITDKDKEQADCAMRLNQVTQMLSQMSRVDKIAWSHEARKYGNDLYAEGNYKKATEIYLEALLGIDYGDKKPETYQEMYQTIMIPVLNNLALCSFKMYEFDKTILFCDGVLEKDPKNFKAYLRRGITNYSRECFPQASNDLREAAIIAKSEKEKKIVQCELYKLRQAEIKANKRCYNDRVKVQKSMKKMVDDGCTLYSDIEKNKKKVSNLGSEGDEKKINNNNNSNNNSIIEEVDKEDDNDQDQKENTIEDEDENNDDDGLIFDDMMMKTTNNSSTTLQSYSQIPIVILNKLIMLILMAFEFLIALLINKGNNNNADDDKKKKKRN